MDIGIKDCVRREMFAADGQCLAADDRDEIHTVDLSESQSDFREELGRRITFEKRSRDASWSLKEHMNAELKESAKGSARANRARCATEEEINASCEPCVARTRRSTGPMSVAVSVILLPEASYRTLTKIVIVVLRP